MDTRRRLDRIVRVVLNSDVQEELGVAPSTVITDGPLLRFRMVPGKHFERHGAIQDNIDGTYSLVVMQRYLPGYGMSCAGRACVASLNELEAELRIAVRSACEREQSWPHWLQRLRRAQREERLEYPLRDPSAVGDALSAATTRAETSGAVQFVYREPDHAVCATAPPQDAKFFSVTANGDWAVHWKENTWPLGTVPAIGLGALRGAGPARVASCDVVHDAGRRAGPSPRTRPVKGR